MIFVKVLSILLLFVVISHLGSCKSKDDCQCACGCSPKIHVRLANSLANPVAPTIPAVRSTPSSASTTPDITTTTAMTTATTQCQAADFLQDVGCDVGQRLYDSLCMTVIEPAVTWSQAACVGYLMKVSGEADLAPLAAFTKDECLDTMWVDGTYFALNSVWTEKDGKENAYFNTLFGTGDEFVGKCVLYDKATGNLMAAPCNEVHIRACVEDKAA